MFGIKEILNKYVLNKPLTGEEKFRILNSKRINPKVVEYLMERFRNLYIEVLGKCKGSLFLLMYIEGLEGWCWQTTESAIVFLNDDDYIERGYLHLSEQQPRYYHSWICFNYNGTEYVLDPSLNLLCKKSDYSRIFEAEVIGMVNAKAVKEELIRQVTAPKKVDNSEEAQMFNRVMRNIIGSSYDKIKEEKKDEVIVDGPEDVNTPLYRNGAGYKTEIENGVIKKLTVHYYYTDG